MGNVFLMKCREGVSRFLPQTLEIRNWKPGDLYFQWTM